jgi:hypothetical protein
MMTKTVISVEEVAEMHKFVVMMPGGSVRGSYANEEQAQAAANKYGFLVVQVRVLRVLKGDSDNNNT